MGRAAASYVRENFSLDVIANRWRQVLAAALPLTHAAAAQPSVQLPELCREPLFVPRRLPRQWLALCQRSGAVPMRLQEVDGPDCALALVAGGLGTGLVPATITPPPGIVLRPIAAVEAALEVALAWWNDDVSPTLTRFLEVARRACA